MVVAAHGKEIVGIIAVKAYTHISLLFVNKKYHRMGIARNLFDEVRKRSSARNINEIIVNSSPYAEPVYKKLGFKATSLEKCVNGIIFIPMKYEEF